MLKPDQVTSVACGRHHTLVAMRSEISTLFDFVIYWDWRDLLTLYCQVFANLNIYLARSGMCWSFGSNSEGQLGTGRGGGEWSSTPVPWEGVAGGVTR